MARNEGLKKLKKLRIYMIILCVIGIGLSLYALYVELSKEADGGYQALCDISSYISCSKVFTSKYGRGFGIIGELVGEKHFLNQPNSIPGIMFYTMIFALGEIKAAKAAEIQKWLVFGSNFMSLYLAYILYFILHDFCVVCVATYIVNLLLTFCAFQKVSVMQNFKMKSK